MSFQAQFFCLWEQGPGTELSSQARIIIGITLERLHEKTDQVQI